MAVKTGTDTECYCVCCDGMGMAMQTGTDTECYFDFVRVWGWQCIQELMLNVTLFGERVWGWQCRQELILNVTVFVMGVERAI